MTKPRLVLEVAELPVTFHAYKDHIAAIIQFGPNQTVGLRFLSPEHLLNFCTGLMEQATKTWPNHPLVKEYLED